MLKLSKVAVTGGLSCGKSSVCLFLKELGAYTISSDDIVHQILSSDTKFSQEIIRLLGTDIIVNQKIDRSLVAQKVFHDPQLLLALERILHPVVFDEIDKEYCKQKANSPLPPLFIAEVPLLFESNREMNFDYTVVVLADPELCQKRFISGTKHNEAEYKQRMNRQLSPSDKAKRADYIIMNNGSLIDLKQKTLELYQLLTRFQPQ